MFFVYKTNKTQGFKIIIKTENKKKTNNIVLMFLFFFSHLNFLLFHHLSRYN